MDWILIALISALLSAVAAISQKKILFDLDALDFSFVLALFNMIFSLFFLFWVDFSEVTFLSLLILYGKTILGALAFLCVMLSLKNMEISGALPLMVLTPGIVAFFAFFLLSESLSHLEIWGMALLLIGTYILESGKSGDLLKPFKVFVTSKFHHYIVFALLLFTATAILDKMLLKNYSLKPYPFMAFQQIFLAVNFFIMILISKRSYKKVFNTVVKGKLKWIVFISLVSIGYRYTQIEAVKIAPVALVLSVKRFSVFFATIIGGKLFNEHNILKKAIATLILIAGALLIINSGLAITAGP